MRPPKPFWPRALLAALLYFTSAGTLLSVFAVSYPASLVLAGVCVGTFWSAEQVAFWPLRLLVLNSILRRRESSKEAAKYILDVADSLPDNKRRDAYSTMQEQAKLTGVGVQPLTAWMVLSGSVFCAGRWFLEIIEDAAEGRPVKPLSPPGDKQ